MFVNCIYKINNKKTNCTSYNFFYFKIYILFLSLPGNFRIGPHPDWCEGTRHTLIPNNPVKRSFCQSDDPVFRPWGNSANNFWNSLYNRLFPGNSHFNQIKTVQFSGLSTSPFFGWGLGRPKKTPEILAPGGLLNACGYCPRRRTAHSVVDYRPPK